MDVSASVDALQQAFVELVLALESETNETHLDFGDDFESFVCATESLELLGKAAMTTNVSLKDGQLVLFCFQPLFTLLEGFPRRKDGERTTA